jgi:D-alanine-D-alanine ligase
MGGYSREFEISLKSGNVVYNTLKNRYNCYRIHILKDEWFLLNNINEKLSIDRETFKTERGPLIEFDCIFNAIHGPPGENGIMNKYFTKLGIPITGCSSKQSKLTFDKIKCLEFLKNRGIKTADSIVIKKNTKFVMSKVEETIGFPCFVKASKSGSSFGVYKVYNEKEFVDCLNSAFKIDHEVLVESYIEGREFSVGVITFKNKVEVLPITEIIASNDFFDYEAKYEGKSDEITPAKISDELMNKLSQSSKNVYNQIGLMGFSRSEFIVNDYGIYYLETNTVPGLTSESILPQQAKCAGITLEDLFSNAIKEVVK